MIFNLTINNQTVVLESVGKEYYQIVGVLPYELKSLVQEKEVYFWALQTEDATYFGTDQREGYATANYEAELRELLVEPGSTIRGFAPRKVIQVTNPIFVIKDQYEYLHPKYFVDYAKAVAKKEELEKEKGWSFSIELLSKDEETTPVQETSEVQEFFDDGGFDIPDEEGGGYDNDEAQTPEIKESHNLLLVDGEKYVIHEIAGEPDFNYGIFQYEDEDYLPSPLEGMKDGNWMYGVKRSKGWELKYAIAQNQANDEFKKLIGSTGLNPINYGAKDFTLLPPRPVQFHTRY